MGGACAFSMGTKQVFLRQLLACHDENHWFACLQQSLMGVTEEQANWKESTSSHSIHQIVNHLITFNGRCLDRFNGEPVPPIEGRNDDTFLNGDDLDWDVSVATLTTIMDDWLLRIQGTTDRDWERNIHDRTSETWG